MALFTNKYPYTDFHELNLDWVIEQVQTVTKLVEDINNRVVTKEYLNQQLALYNSSLNVKIDNNKKQIDDAEERLNLEMAELQRQFELLYRVMIDHQQLVDDEFKQMYIDLQKYIDEHIGKVTQLYVISPVTGKLEDVTKVLNDIWDRLLAIGALTASEYDNLQLTATKYDYYFLSAIKYDSGAKWVFFDRLYQMITSPFDGKKTLIKDVIYKLADLHKSGITATAYDAMGLNADSYDAMLVTAYEFDWQGI